MKKPRFSPGQIVATPGALEALEEAAESPGTLLKRHLTGEWGEVDEHDRHANERALADGSRLLSAYTLPTGVKLWIITEADRSATSLLLPSEY